MARRIALFIIAALLIAVLPAAPLAQAQSPAPCAVAAAAALAQRGAPYVWGAKGPVAFDCSGLVYYSWLLAGYNIGVSTYDQARQGIAISCSLSDLAGTATTCWEAGDLIFLRYTGGQHVAMYIGNGLFADAYNSATGVVIHNPATDSFYQAHYWQSRRIVSCDGVTVNPGTSNPVLSTPGLEDLPDLLAPVSFSVPQCGACNPDGSIIMPATEWDGQWPANPLDLGAMFQAAISWLAWRISELLRILICWLLSMLGYLAAFLAALANVVVGGINGLWRLLLLFWFAFQEWMAALFYLLADIADGLAGLAMFGQIISFVLLGIDIALSFLGLILVMIGGIAGQIIGVLGWVGGIVIGGILAILQALASSTVPEQLSGTSVIYYGLRGMLEGLRDSAFGWVLVLFWGACYVGFVYWVSRFLSGSSAKAD